MQVAVSNAIEAPILKGEIPGVTHTQLHFRALGFGLPRLKQLWHEAEPGSPCASAGRGARGIAGATCDIEYFHPWFDSSPGANAFAHISDVW